MNTTKRIQPRFIPTLTEVVAPANVKPYFLGSKFDVEEVVAEVNRQVLPMIEQRLQAELDQLIRTMIKTQLSEISMRFRKDMEIFIRQTVVGALNKTELQNSNNLTET
jgi:rRNA-processing protein FCF1